MATINGYQIAARNQATRDREQQKVVQKLQEELRDERESLDHLLLRSGGTKKALIEEVQKESVKKFNHALAGYFYALLELKSNLDTDVAKNYTNLNKA